jgi:hypothetical protein
VQHEAVHRVLGERPDAKAGQRQTGQGAPSLLETRMPQDGRQHRLENNLEDEVGPVRDFPVLQCE